MEDVAEPEREDGTQAGYGWLTGCKGDGSEDLYMSIDGAWA